MSYQVLARKYRPKNFETLVGQEHVVRALTHALGSGRLHHAYLFTGTRGVGKTTLSRILAKSLNCIGPDGSGGITAQPCGQCEACTAIDAGRFVDYIEMDAASNRGVDEMAQLLEQAVYAPSNARFKVYMIDEVHMLTNHAFNSMLKTLEEPPEHVKFILATTDPQKIPVTVLSRCLQFNLKQMPPGHIVSHLDNILGQEGISFEQPALRLLAQGAHGSMRDALSLTDQAIAYAAGAVTLDAVQGMLGALDQSYLVRLLDALASQDGADLLAVADEMAARSLSYNNALQDLGTLLHRIALAQTVPAAVPADLPEYADIIRLAGAFDAEEVQLYYQIAVHGRNELGLAPDEYAGFSMTLLRMLAFRPGNGGAEGVPPAGAASGRPAGGAAGVARAAVAPARAASLAAASHAAVTPPAVVAGAAAAMARAAAAPVGRPQMPSVSPAAAATAAATPARPVSATAASPTPVAPAAAAAASTGRASASADAFAPLPSQTASTSDDAFARSLAKAVSEPDDAFAPLPATAASAPDDAFAPSPTRPASAPDDAFAPLQVKAESASDDAFAPAPVSAASIPDDAFAPLPTKAASASDDVFAASPATKSSAPDDAFAPEPVAAAAPAATPVLVQASMPAPAVAPQFTPPAAVAPAVTPQATRADSAPANAASVGRAAALEAARAASGQRSGGARPAPVPSPAKVPASNPVAAPLAQSAAAAGPAGGAAKTNASAPGAATVAAPASASAAAPRAPAPWEDAPAAAAPFAAASAAAPTPSPARQSAQDLQPHDQYAQNQMDQQDPSHDMQDDDLPPWVTEFSDDTASAAAGPAASAPAAVASRPAAAPAQPPRPYVIVPVAGLDWDGNWPAVAAALPLRGVAQQLAVQTELIECLHDGHSTLFKLRVPFDTLRSAANVDKLVAALGERFDRKVQVETELGAVWYTASAEAQAYREANQLQAEQTIRNDPFVLSLMRDFGAVVVPGSIMPAPAAAP